MVCLDVVVILTNCLKSLKTAKQDDDDDDDKEELLIVARAMEYADSVFSVQATVAISAEEPAAVLVACLFTVKRLLERRRPETVGVYFNQNLAGKLREYVGLAYPEVLSWLLEQEGSTEDDAPEEFQQMLVKRMRYLL